MQEKKQTEPTLKETNNNFPKTVFGFIGFIFVVSSLSGILSNFFDYDNPLKRFFEGGAYFWFLAMGISGLFIVVFFFTGLFTIKKGGTSLMGYAVLLFLAALVVGAGTCFVNMSNIF